MERVNEKYFEMKENNNSRYQNFWNAAKAMLRGKFITINSYTKKITPHINDLTFQIRHWKKKSRAK